MATAKPKRGSPMLSHRWMDFLSAIGSVCFLVGGAGLYDHFPGPALACLVAGHILGLNYLHVIIVDEKEYRDKKERIWGE